MRHLVILFVSSLSLLAPGCGGKPQPNGAACSGKTGSEGTCAGSVCLQLTSNQQGLAGMCSERCDDGRCQEGGVCAAIDGLGSFCLATCQRDGDCRDGFVCLKAGDLSYCGVRTGAPPTPGAVECRKSADCTSVTPQDPACGGVPQATKLCDCGQAPTTGCVPAPTGTNLWCCS